MTSDLRPYLEYKDSGLPWLGRVPAHWDVMRCKYLFREVDERSKTGEETHLSMSQQHGLIPSKDLDGRRLHSESYVGAKLCQTNDLVLNRLKAHLGVFAHARQPGLVSPDYTVLRPVHSDDVVYFEHVFKTPPCVAELRCSTKGIVEGFWRLYTDDFYNIRVPVPPETERTAILSFVRALDAKVRRFIRNRRRLIEVLNEQKQAIINQAVTRGLDPNVPLKPSGIDWLGDIPKSWKCVPIKRIAILNPTRSEAFHLRDSHEPVVFLPMEKVSTQGDVDTSLRRPISEVWQGFTYFRRGDVVVAKITPCFENGKGACLSDLPTEIGFGTTEFIVLRAHAGLTPEWLYQLTCLTHFRALGVESMTGAAGQQRVSQDFVANFPVPLPSPDEQLEIVGFIEHETARFRTAIAMAEREISLIREYRTRLIADVVTGKLDVRHLAPPPQELERVGDAELDADELLDDELLENDDELVEELADADE